MVKTYGRFNELKLKDLEKFELRRPVEEQLTYAVIEVSMMQQNEVPEYKWEMV